MSCYVSVDCDVEVIIEEFWERVCLLALLQLDACYGSDRKSKQILFATFAKQR